jgi:VWFA-related protein
VTRGAIVTAAAMAAALVGTTSAQERPRPTFRSGVARVAVTAVVQTRDGRPVTDVRPEELELYDRGERRPITEVRREDMPVQLALLVDASGSMKVAARQEAARGVAGQLLAWLRPGVDQVGLFAFDSRLEELHPVAPVTPATPRLLERLDSIQPYGMTSLFDAIAHAGERVAAAGALRRAVVALTDGADNASALTPAEVSGLANAIDVPVYVLLVASPLDLAGWTPGDPLPAEASGRLRDLSRWTGGALFAATGPARTSLAARQIVEELRHQYLIAFEPGDAPGWHPIEIRTTRRNVVVRTRSGYVVDTRPAGAPAQ